MNRASNVSNVLRIPTRIYPYNVTLTCCSKYHFLLYRGIVGVKLSNTMLLIFLHLRANTTCNTTFMFTATRYFVLRTVWFLFFFGNKPTYSLILLDIKLFGKIIKIEYFFFILMKLLVSISWNSRMKLLFKMWIHVWTFIMTPISIHTF